MSGYIDWMAAGYRAFPVPLGSMAAGFYQKRIEDKDGVCFFADIYEYPPPTVTDDFTYEVGARLCDNDGHKFEVRLLNVGSPEDADSFLCNAWERLGCVHAELREPPPMRLHIDSDGRYAFHPKGFPLPEAWPHHANPRDAFFAAVQDGGAYEGLSPEEAYERTWEAWKSFEDSIKRLREERGGEEE